MCLFCTYLRTGWASLLRGRGMPPPAEALGRGRPLRGGAKERVGVEVAELGLGVALTGCLRASGDGVAGVRSLLGEGTEDRQSRNITGLLLVNLYRFQSISSLSVKL